MTKKSHDRSPDKKNFSIALPIVMIGQLQQIAEAEHRSRNRQIEKFLEESVKLWEKSKKAATPQTIAPPRVLPNPKSSPISRAAGATANRSSARIPKRKKTS